MHSPELKFFCVSLWRFVTMTHAESLLQLPKPTLIYSPRKWKFLFEIHSFRIMGIFRLATVGISATLLQYVSFFTFLIELTLIYLPVSLNRTYIRPKRPEKIAFEEQTLFFQHYSSIIFLCLFPNKKKC